MSKNLKTKSEGFTIIEVLIVLAIAGLIMLVVFLAVPALQRNSRNTTARSEASGVLGAVSEFTANNNGKLPAAGASTTAGTDAAKVWSNTKAQNLTSIVVEAEAGTTAPTAAKAVVATQAKCAKPTSTMSDRAGITTAGAGRQVALLYVIEDSSGDLMACSEG